MQDYLTIIKSSVLNVKNAAEHSKNRIKLAKHLLRLSWLSKLR